MSGSSQPTKADLLKQVEELQAENLELQKQATNVLLNAEVLDDGMKVDVSQFLQHAARIATHGASAQGFPGAVRLVKNSITLNGQPISDQEAARLIKTKIQR